MKHRTASAVTRRDRYGPAAPLAAAATYAMYGQHIRCEFRLPAPRVSPATRTAIAWTIRRGPLGAPSPPPTGTLIDDHRDVDGTPIDRFYRSDGEAYLWDRLAATCRLEPSKGWVTVYPHPSADEDDLGLLLLGAVSSFMLHQKGYPNLHASAVVTPSGACAFIGPSTLGKSTLAAGLLRRGGRLLTDDILPLDFRPDGVYGIPGPPMMKVWSNTAEHTFGISTGLPRLSSLTEKRLLDAHHHAYAVEACPTYIRAIYVPRRYDPTREGRTDVRIEPLTSRDAALALLAQTYRGHYLFPRELAVLLGQYARLVTQARVAALHIPHGLQYQEVVTEKILTDLAAL